MRFPAIFVLMLVMLCCFVADLRAEPAAAAANGSVQVIEEITPDVTSEVMPDANYGDELEPCLSEDCCSNCRLRSLGRYQCRLPSHWRSTRDMFQRTPYMSEPDDYYYFRPYNHMHIGSQQTESQNYGLDIHNPYANDLFEGVYQEVEAEIRSQADAPPKPAAN